MIAPTTPPASNPLESVAMAMKTAGSAIRDGAGDANAKVQELLPKVGQTVSTGVYNGSYYLSFGLVFPTLFLCRIIPGGNAIASGVIDGASAASETVKGWREQTPAPTPAQ
ncbi:MAG: hypothetical protein ACKV0T_09360 [Planctomycetales bacterium]